ncbi:hypothetical protein EMIT0P43_20292 [Pseudomonas jessenii]
MTLPRESPMYLKLDHPIITDHANLGSGHHLLKTLITFQQ